MAISHLVRESIFECALISALYYGKKTLHPFVVADIDSNPISRKIE